MHAFVIADARHRPARPTPSTGRFWRRRCRCNHLASDGSHLPLILTGADPNKGHSRPVRKWSLICITWAVTMAIHKLLQNSPMGPEEIGRLVGAYGQTLLALGLTDRKDRITEMVAAKVFEIGQTGIGDAAEISRLAIQAL